MVNAAMSFFGLFQNDAPSNDVRLRKVVADLRKAWPDNRIITIVCHGHSVPAGYLQPPIVDTLSAYPHQLLRRLKQAYPYAMINVIVTAIGGEHAVQGAARFDDVLKHDPDVVTIDYSLNDRVIGLARAKAAWAAMIGEAKARGAAVILLTPSPDTDNAEQLDAHAEQVRQLGAEHGVAVVDSFNIFAAYRCTHGSVAALMASSNHPSPDGSALIADSLAEVLGAHDAAEDRQRPVGAIGASATTA